MEELSEKYLHTSRRMELEDKLEEVKNDCKTRIQAADKAAA